MAGSSVRRNLSSVLAKTKIVNQQNASGGSVLVTEYSVTHILSHQLGDVRHAVWIFLAYPYDLESAAESTWKVRQVPLSSGVWG
jgi:hypothetical protein